MYTHCPRKTTWNVTRTAIPFLLPTSILLPISHRRMARSQHHELAYEAEIAEKDLQTEEERSLYLGMLMIENEEPVQDGTTFKGLLTRVKRITPPETRRMCLAPRRKARTTPTLRARGSGHPATAHTPSPSCYRHYRLRHRQQREDRARANAPGTSDIQRKAGHGQSLHQPPGTFRGRQG